MRDLRSLQALLPVLVLVGCAQGGGGAPTPSAAGATPQDVEWTLRELGGAPIQTAEGGRPPTLLLAGAERRATGHAGCNRMTGTYESAGETLRFGAMATTRMYCPAMDLEQRYLAALGGTRSYRRSEGSLELLDERGAVVAKFSQP
ncbi:MAG TPA: META domain-containing protein [Gemmatimonadales bacterium]|nr:META domain-containing protein [Gemmatimonadales bacterium]